MLCLMMESARVCRVASRWDCVDGGVPLRICGMMGVMTMPNMTAGRQKQDNMVSSEYTGVMHGAKEGGQGARWSGLC